LRLQSVLPVLVFWLAACEASVGPAAVASIDVAPQNATVAVGGTQQYAATPRDASGNALTGRTVTWSLQTGGVANISSAGLLTAIAPGSAVVVATSENISGLAPLLIRPASGASGGQMAARPTTALQPNE